MLTFISCLVYLSFILVGIGVYVYYHFSSWVESDVESNYFFSFLVNMKSGKQICGISFESKIKL